MGIGDTSVVIATDVTGRSRAAVPTKHDVTPSASTAPTFGYSERGQRSRVSIWRRSDTSVSSSATSTAERSSDRFGMQVTLS